MKLVRLINKSRIKYIAINSMKRNYNIIGYLRIRKLIPFYFLSRNKRFSSKIPRISENGFYNDMYITDQKSLSSRSKKFKSIPIKPNRVPDKIMELVNESSKSNRFQRSIDKNSIYESDLYYDYYRNNYAKFFNTNSKFERYFILRRII